jgi:8-oxo-dGTP pyrophosphatase MutT (NUDIX family)
MGQKYKVFLNERLIIIGSTKKADIKNPTISFDPASTVQEISEWFHSFIKTTYKVVVLLHPEPDKFFRIFRKVFLEIPAAGGVVLSNEKILFLFRNDKWDLPKGKIDSGESAEQAALREVEEECGISGQQIVRQLPSTYHIYISPYKKTKGEWVFKETVWFEMTYSGINPGKPEKNEGITEIKWFSKNELDEVFQNTYENLKQIISIYRD